MKTKSYYLIIGLFLFLEICLNAQSFKYGLLAGLDVTKTYMTNQPDGEDNKLYDPMTSFNVNGYIGYKSAKFWGISLEPGYIQKGGAQRYDTETKDDDIRLQLNYIQIPILADLYLTDKFFISVGPELAYMISAKAKSMEISNDIRDFYTRNFEVSGLIGLNFNVIKNFDIGIRYNHGITYISEIIYLDEMGDPTETYSKEYNQYIQLVLRFKI
jgi:hypothetical protein